MEKQLKKMYEMLFDVYHLEQPIEAGDICGIISKSLRSFLVECKNPAIYCNGGHTKMLMADFMCELRNVKYIVDNYSKEQAAKGFHIIRDEELEQYGIDGVIISSFKFREDIVKSLQEKHPNLKYLNLYDKFAENGIDLQSDYYYHNHPYHYYHSINGLQKKIRSCTEKEELITICKEIITKYIHIKDFRTAIYWAQQLIKQDRTKESQNLLYDIQKLYEQELLAISQIAEENVLMLCVDGLRRRDLEDESLPKLSKELRTHAYVFNDAYSYSTSTYESLIPVYSENKDLSTHYYQKNVVPEEACRFIQKAKQQKRNIFFYSDMDEFIDSDCIQRSGAFQTVTEKIWNFILDAEDEKKGLFYIHILYESHYSFSNPYTRDSLISEGTAMLFDFLPQKGGKLRTNYEQQHNDSMKYLDDVLTPFIKRLKCRMLFFADHGNLMLEQNCSLNNVRKDQLLCGEEWVQIPYVIKSPEMQVGESNQLMTLMSLNDIVISLLEKTKYEIPNNEYIKIARSELYNPDFRFLYKEIEKEKYLQAFEAFIFSNHLKLIVFADGTMELYEGEKDTLLEDSKTMCMLARKVKKDITVCNIEEEVALHESRVIS